MTPETETKCYKDRFWSQCNVLLLKNNLLDWLQDTFHTIMYADNTLTLEKKNNKKYKYNINHNQTIMTYRGVQRIHIFHIQIRIHNDCHKICLNRIQCVDHSI